MSMDIPDCNRIAIIGAKGQMGGLFTQRARACGREVLELDQPLEGAGLDELTSCGMAFLCVPVTAFRSVLSIIVPKLHPTAILSDVCSVKVLPMRQMSEVHVGPVVGTHPLFGPVIPEGFEPKVAVVPAEGADSKPVHDLLRDMGFLPFASTPEEHDRATAFVQGLNFISTVAHLSAMRQVEGIENYLTPSFLRRLESAKKMLTQDQTLFETISDGNPFLQETVRQFTGFLNIAAGGDLELLADRARWWWRDEE